MSSDKEWNGKSKRLFKIYCVLYIVEKLFGCTKDCGICCYGFCCTPCLFGSNAKKIDDKNCVLMCCVYGLLANIYLCWVPHLFERRTLREKYNLKEDSTCGDIGATLCCGPCALCQEAREMKSRGK
jgi:Cys-rich protein (TIGR01571 family)